MRTVFKLLILSIVLIVLQHQVSAQTITLKPRLIALQVHDLDVSREWYKNTLDFKVENEKDFKEYRMRITLLKQGEFQLELVDHENSFFVKDSVPDAGDQNPVIGFAKLTLEVKEIERVYDRLKKAGVKISYHLTESNIDASEKWFMVQDPDGNSIQLIGKYR